MESNLVTIEEIKEYLRLDEDYEDKKIKPWIIASKVKIKLGTGLSPDEIKDPDIVELYKLTQLIIINNIYEDPSAMEGDTSGVTSLMILLESYKNTLILNGGNNATKN